MRPPVFLTGATGFLGMEVLARLLEQGDREIVALVRARDNEEASERLDGILRRLWRDPSPYRGRVRAVAGDVTSAGLGIDAAERTGIAEDIGAIMHCAASISFDMPRPTGWPIALSFGAPLRRSSQVLRLTPACCR